MTFNHDVLTAPTGRAGLRILAIVCGMLVAACDASSAPDATPPEDPAAGVEMTSDDVTEVSPPTFEEMVVTGAWARPAVEGATTAAYLVVTNNLPADDTLLEVSSTDAATAGLHETVMEGEMMSMRPATDGIPVPGNAEAVLEPGGYHIMLEGLARDLVEGDTVSFILGFENYGNLAVDAEVRSR